MLAPMVLLATALASTGEADASPDIVVQAVRGQCRIVYAGSVMDGRALARMADGWPEGRPLRVLEPRGASRKCLTKITLQLADKGFRSLRFVDPPER